MELLTREQFLKLSETERNEYLIALLDQVSGRGVPAPSIMAPQEAVRRMPIYFSAN